MTGGEILRLLLRIDAGTLTAPEREALANLVRHAVGATHVIRANPGEAPEFAAGAWVPVAEHVSILLDTARGPGPTPADPAPDPVVQPGQDDAHRMLGGLLVACGLVLVVALIFLAVSRGWLW